MKDIFTVIAGILYMVGFVPYAVAIIRKRTRPSKASWIIWTLLDTITIAAMYAKDAVNGQILGTVIGAWIVVFLAMKYGTPGWTQLDKLCLSGAVLGVVLWWVFNNPIVGMAISLCVVTVGSIPTFVSAWKNPENEDKLAWTIFTISCLFALLAIPKLTFEDVVQPASFTTIELIMMYILFIHKPTVKPQSAT